MRFAGKETGGKAQICLPNQGFGVEFKGLGKNGLVCRSTGGLDFSWRASAVDLPG